MKTIEKLKAKYPIGSILKHKHCSLMYKVIDFEFRPGYTVNKILVEHWVHLEILFYPKDKIGTKMIIHLSYLKELELSSEEYLNMLLEKRKSICQKN